MRRVINLIHFGNTALIVIGLFGVALPGLLFMLSLVLEAAHLPSLLVHRLLMGSLAVGGVLLAAYIILLMIEQIQDGVLYQMYQKARRKRLPLANGCFECQFCGCRTLREFEHTCPVCGKALE